MSSMLNYSLKKMFDYPVSLTNFDETSLIKFCFPKVVKFSHEKGAFNFEK